MAVIMTKEEIIDISEQSADKAVAKFALMMGIDVSIPANVLELQAQFRHLRNQYEACRVVKNVGIKTAVGTVLTAFGAYILLFFGFKPH